MHNGPLRLIVLARDQRSFVQESWRQLSAFLAEQTGVVVVAEEVTRDLQLDGLDADLVIVLGGDGAILRACRKLGWRQLPLLGLNLGRLGFLTHLTLEGFYTSFPMLRDRQYQVVDHLMFECIHRPRHGEPQSWLGLNEIAISSGRLRMVDLALTIDGQPVTTYSGDGLIISTPIGSTAHSLSAGGPILQQTLQAFVITPICPHTLTMRPLVDRADAVYQITLPHDVGEVLLVIDGQIQLPVRQGDVIELRKAPVSFQSVRIPEANYYKTLFNKLGWAGQPRYRDQSEPG